MRPFTNPNKLGRDTLIAFAIAIIIWLVGSLLSGCARVPVAMVSPNPGEPGTVAYMTTLGGSVNITPAQVGGPAATISTDHTASFADATQTVNRLITWNGIDKVSGKAFGWLRGRSQDKAAIAATTQTADLAALREANRHTESIQAAENAFTLQSAEP